MFPVTIPTLKYGITSNIVMRIWNKLLVLLGTYGLYQFFPNHIMIYSISLVALTDIITFMFFLRLGNKSYDTFLNFATNLIFRSAYFFILFEVFNIL